MIQHVFYLHGLWFMRYLIRVHSSCPSSRRCSVTWATASLLSGFHPQMSSQPKRINQEIETALHCIMSHNPSSWSSHLVRVKKGQNSLTSSAIGLSPFQCLRMPDSPVFSPGRRHLLSYWAPAQITLLHSLDADLLADCHCHHPGQPVSKTTCQETCFHNSEC